MKNKLKKLGNSIKANKKKIIVVACMVALLVATGCLNYFLNVKEQEGLEAGQGDLQTTETFFSTYRTDREETRAQELEYLDEIIASASSTESAVASAEEQKLQITGAMETAGLTQTVRRQQTALPSLPIPPFSPPPPDPVRLRLRDGIAEEQGF